MTSVWEGIKGFLYLFYKSLCCYKQRWWFFFLSYIFRWWEHPKHFGLSQGMMRCLHPLLTPLPEIYECGGLFGSWPLGRKRGERKSWCLHVALVTGITSLLIRACPPPKPGFNFLFEMQTGSGCQFRFHWSAVWHILVPGGHFFLLRLLTGLFAVTSPWSIRFYLG